MATEAAWLNAQLTSLTTELELLTPSQWAERVRYLPASVSPMPGPYRFDVTPFLREVLDCLDPMSPIRSVALMKGVQMGATSGILENAFGYLIDYVKHAPAMLVTAEAELAHARLDQHVLPMLHASGLADRIVSADVGNARKTGKTRQKLEWVGGGYALLIGAKNPGKMRSLPIRFLFRDECDAFADVIGKDGDPMALTEARTNSFEATRKVLDVSTPLLKGTSKIAKRFMAGDQRYYFVRCRKCSGSQRLRWRRQDPDTGEVTGIVWRLDDSGTLVPGSVRYTCKFCGHAHSEADKAVMLAPAHGAEWRSTATPADPTHRSYHLSALYSPFFTWESCVRSWLTAWDPVENRPRDHGALQTFYNNVLGEPYEVRGEGVRFERVNEHKRDYRFGEVPNKFATRFCGSPVLFVLCTVDVQGDYLSVATWGFTREARAFLLDYWRFDGDTETPDGPPWTRLDEVLTAKEYVADDGARYRIALALVDSGYRSDTVNAFCQRYAAGVVPIKGSTQPADNAYSREFSQMHTPTGIPGFLVTVDFYKARLAGALKRGWDGLSMQPPNHFNAPSDASEKQLKQLTVETYRAKIEKGTGKVLGYEWHRPHGVANELWDLFVYASFGHDLLAWDYAKERELERVNLTEFYEACVSERRFLA